MKIQRDFGIIAKYKLILPEDLDILLKGEYPVAFKSGYLG
jgi:hypothetical protein